MTPELLALITTAVFLGWSRDLIQSGEKETADAK